MAKGTRRNHPAAYKAKRVLAAIGGKMTLGELAQQHEVHPGRIMAWKRRLAESAVNVFEESPSWDQDPDVERLHAKIGQETMEKYFLKSSAHQGGKAEIERSHALPLKRQAELAGISRSNLDYRPSPFPNVTLI